MAVFKCFCTVFAASAFFTVPHPLNGHILSPSLDPSNKFLRITAQNHNLDADKDRNKYLIANSYISSSITGINKSKRHQINCKYHVLLLIGEYIRETCHPYVIKGQRQKFNKLLRDKTFVSQDKC